MSPDDVKDATRACYWHFKDAISDLQKARMILSKYASHDTDAYTLLNLIAQVENRLETGKQFCHALAIENKSEITRLKLDISK